MTTWKPVTWSEVYANRTPNELEERLAEQRKPGHIPKETGVLRYGLGSIWRLPASDKRRQLLVSREVNHEELSNDDLKFVFGND